MKQFSIPAKYKSPLITSIKKKRKELDKQKKDFSATILDFDSVKIILARHFGFCYGVENAIEIAFKTVEENPGRRIFLLSEMIHNPFVNRDLLAMGVKFIMDTKGNNIIPFEQLNKDDIVMIPAFGTTIDIENKLTQIGIQVEKYNTTCPFVEKVWNRAEQIAGRGYSIVVHGKPSHEETRATFSHSDKHTPTLVINDIKEAAILGEFMLGKKPENEFYEYFKGRFSAGFDMNIHLSKFGVVNQTTMLASDTQEIVDHLRQIMIAKYPQEKENISERFADTRDTLCYATNDNQTAVKSMLENDADFSIVIGGRNSSNSSHLVELSENKLPTYFIESENDIISNDSIKGYNWKTHEEYIKHDYIPSNKPVRILLTSGASCPDAIVETVIEKLLTFFPDAKALDEIKEEWV
jgi:4-hydroxy-3-methylbut-2-enyl diphosphate reductase